MFLDLALAMLDVLLVTFLLYKTIMFFLNTRAFATLKGIAILLLLWLISGIIGLETLTFVISQISIYGILALIILFKTEIRSALEKLGKNNLNYKTNAKETGTPMMIENLIQASKNMSENKVGALICIELEDSLSDYIKTGINLNANISKELLLNIFTPKVPLHDGALIIRKLRAEAASCFLPLSHDDSLSKELGTRHRAAVGLCEQSDALIIVVSEETGSISVAKDNQLHRGVTEDALRAFLHDALIPKGEKPKLNTFFKGRNA